MYKVSKLSVSSEARYCKRGQIVEMGCTRAGLSNAAPVIYFPGAPLYSAGFNINQNFRKKYF
jgi:hypothetical protein